MSKTQELAVIPTSDSQQSIMSVIARAASDPAVDVGKMERLYAMLKEEKLAIANQHFNEAMRKAQMEMPRIVKDAKNSQNNSRYVQLETLSKVAIPIYTANGFSLMFSEGESANPAKIRVVCEVSHEGGHSRSYHLDLSPDDTGAKGNASKTKIHGEGSTFSYGQRYLMKLIFNLTIVGEDDDGNQGQKPKPQGPNSMEPSETTLRDLALQLWNAMASVRGTERNWDVANQWLWREEITDGGIPETVPNLSAKRFHEVIAAVKQKLA
jgi:ERF superfamily